METDLLSNVRGNVQALRNMWSSKSQEQEKSLPPTRRHSEQQQQSVKTTNEATIIPTIKKESPVLPKAPLFESVDRLPSVEENISTPPLINFQHVQNVILSKDPKMTSTHRWHVTRHVVRSGLLFDRSRRASDSILPLLFKTHAIKHYSDADSVDSTNSQTLFENRVDYLTYDKDSLKIPTKTKRSASDAADCIRRNKLDDSIFQYEMILRHLKNYEQFKTTYPTALIPSKQQGKSFDNEPINLPNEMEEKFLAKTSIPNRKTQSLSRYVGRTFSEFIMNDLFRSTSSKRTSNEPRCSISDASSQTESPEIKSQPNNSSDIAHPTEFERNNSIPNEEAKEVLHEFDTMLDNSHQELPITPNTEVNVIVLNSSGIDETFSPVQPLMQRLFEGKKSAYSPADLNMKAFRLPEEMIPEYEAAKKKCFFDSEELIYMTKMIKITRRGYKQHVRMFGITTERVYNITKKDPYPKEGLLLKDILGVTCTPYQDGLICIHTREKYEDRGDWLAVVDHPCELVTKLFMVLGRDNNDDHFLKVETKFQHCRRFYAEGVTTDCTIEARLAESFRIKKAEFDHLIIFTP